MRSFNDRFIKFEEAYSAFKSLFLVAVDAGVFVDRGQEAKKVIRVLLRQAKSKAICFSVNSFEIDESFAVDKDHCKSPELSMMLNALDSVFHTIVPVTHEFRRLNQYLQAAWGENLGSLS